MDTLLDKKRENTVTINFGYSHSELEVAWEWASDFRHLLRELIWSHDLQSKPGFGVFKNAEISKICDLLNNHDIDFRIVGI